MNVPVHPLAVGRYHRHCPGQDAYVRVHAFLTQAPTATRMRATFRVLVPTVACGGVILRLLQRSVSDVVCPRTRLCMGPGDVAEGP
jgi:hypothetical protein